MQLVVNQKPISDLSSRALHQWTTRRYIKIERFATQRLKVWQSHSSKMGFLAKFLGGTDQADPNHRWWIAVGVKLFSFERERRVASATPLLVCFVADAEVLHLMKALYRFWRPPLLPLLCSVLYYTDEWSRLHKSFKILRTADGPAASSLFCCWGIAPHESTVLFSTSAAAIALFRLVLHRRVE